MKLLCLTCDEAMKFATTSNSACGDSLTVAFRCPRCGHRVALMTNPGETRLVHGLGLSVAAGEAAAVPQTLEWESAAPTEATLAWTEEAERRLHRVPEFIRPMVRDSVERYARERGHEQVTVTVLDAVRAQVGM